ncbi:MAG: hypothetical protein K0Q89_698 [Thermomicrobiales bacterium]|nr:hypothetical protein [Thermomicrobiales bacterium]
MLAVSIVQRCRQGSMFLAGLGLVLVVAWMLVTAWSCACAIVEPATMARSSSVPGLIARPMAPRGDHPPEERFSAASAASRDPLMVDRSHDRRVDLMDMAMSLRWHRGTPSGLPPGSD